MSSYVWLITGASSGFGTSFALTALKNGHKVIAGARDPDAGRQKHPDVEKLGGIWLKLDVTAPDVEQTVAAAAKEHGINVLINNAGYAERGALESTPLSEMRAQFETNVFGALAVTKAAIPAMRAARRGFIAFISSTAGIRGAAGHSLYCASKFALEGAAEALAVELAPFDIQLKIFQPGAFRTNFQIATGNQQGVVPPAYEGTPAHEVLLKLRASHGKQPGCPEKAAQIVLEAVTGEGSGAAQKGLIRQPLGIDASDALAAKQSQLKETVDRVTAIGRSAVY